MPRIVCISDTHSQNLNTKWTIPYGDILIHSGDISARGNPEQLRKAGRELASLPHRFKLYTPGNHDREFFFNPETAWQLLPGIIVLLDEEVRLLGLNIYGSPWIKYKVGKFPFEMEDLEEKWDHIPDRTDILVTHMPPISGILDVNYQGEWCGSHSLLSAVRDRVKPRLHCFGHIHGGHGTYTENGITYVNAALTGADRKPAYKPIVIDL